MPDEHSKQKFKDKEKTELKAALDPVSQSNAALPDHERLAIQNSNADDHSAGWPIKKKLKVTEPQNISFPETTGTSTPNDVSSPIIDDTGLPTVVADASEANYSDKVSSNDHSDSDQNVDENDAEKHEATFPELDSKYRIIEAIGQGGMGTVFKAEDLNLNKEVAIKVIRPELATDQTALKRFQQESRALSQLNHPNIVAVYDQHITKSGAPYLVMDYIAGDSLGEAIKNMGAMDVPRALAIFIEICEALHYAHDKGVIHRDLKPANILLADRAGTLSARVVDFGIAKISSKGSGETVTGLTQFGDMFGTPTYMSPEQCEGDPLDERSDIYSFGCVMYEVLTGSPPFADTNPFKLMTKHVNEKAPPLEGFNKSLASVVAKCLEKRPNNRYQSADEIMQDLVAVRNSKEPIHVKKKNKAPRRRKKFDLSDIGRLIIAILPMVAMAYVSFSFVSWPTMKNVATLVTGETFETSPVPITILLRKPDIVKPMLTKPPLIPKPEYKPITGAPFTEIEKADLRNKLRLVNLYQKDSMQPFLSLGTRVVPFLLEEIKSEDQQVSRSSGYVLELFGTPVLPGLVEALRTSANPAIPDTIKNMKELGVAATAPLLNDELPQVRARAAFTVNLATGGNPLPDQISDTMLWLAMEDETATVRNAACNALLKSSREGVNTTDLSYVAINDPSWQVRTTALQTLLTIANEEGDSSQQTLEVFGWIMQSDRSDSIKTIVLRSNYIADHAEALAPYLRGAYYTGSKEIRRLVTELAYRKEIGPALLPEILDSVGKHDVGIYTISSLGERAKHLQPALTMLLVRRMIIDPSDAAYFKQLSTTIANINKQ